MSAIFAEDEQHFDPITSELLVGGKIYLGVAGLDPIVNPINVYDNREFTGSPLGQPIIIDVNGRATNKMWVSGKYSLRIDSSADVLKYQNLQNGFDEAVGNIQTTTPLGVNDITAVGVPVQSAYVDNKTYIVTAPANNTGAMTINIDALGVIPIKKAHDQAIVSGDIKADMKLQLIYNSTDNWMELQGAVLGSVFSSITASGLITAGGGQVAFPATAAPSADANTLDDYEEGNWTPVLWDDSLSNGESQSYTIQVGRYTKIGRIVHFQATIVVAGLGTLTTSQHAKIGGLPFTSNSGANVNTGVAVGFGGVLSITANQSVSATISSNNDFIGLFLWDDSTGSTIMTISELTLNGQLLIGGSYIV